MCDAKPFAKPGRYLAYHAISGGFILAEVVQRVTGKDIRQVLAEEFLDPLGFRWMNYGVDESDLDEVALDYATGPGLLPPFSNLLRRALGVDLDEIVRLANDPVFRTGIVPAGNVVSSANEFSRFYEVMRRGGEIDGVRVIEAETIRTALTQQSHLEADLSLGFPTRFSYGLMLGAQVLSLYGRDTQHAFGHLGFTNMLAWADPERGTGQRVHDQRQAHRLPGGGPLPGPDAADHDGGAEGARFRPLPLSIILTYRVVRYSGKAVGHRRGDRPGLLPGG